MLMMNRVVKMTETGGNFDKGMLKQSWISIRICGSSDATSLVIRLCRDAWAWTQCGSWWFYLGWLGGEGKGRALGVGEVKFTGRVLPTAKEVTYRIHFKRIVNRRLIMGTADGEVLVDGRFDLYRQRPESRSVPGYVCR